MKRNALRLTLLFALPVILVESVPALASTQISSCPVELKALGVYAVTRHLSCTGTAIIVAASNVDLHMGGQTIVGRRSDGTSVR